MPTRCNRGFYCRSYCFLNMFRAPLCPSSGAQEYHTVVAACGISCCGFGVACLFWSCGLCVRFAGFCGHHYAHHQELKIIILWLLPCRIWCFGFQVVGLMWSSELCVRFAGCCGHHYAHHQELKSITHVLVSCGIWRFGFQVVGLV